MVENGITPIMYTLSDIVFVRMRKITPERVFVI